MPENNLKIADEFAEETLLDGRLSVPTNNCLPANARAELFTFRFGRFEFCVTCLNEVLRMMVFGDRAIGYSVAL